VAESSYIGTDDTGARHQGKNGYCTVIGNDLFANKGASGPRPEGRLVGPSGGSGLY